MSVTDPQLKDLKVCTQHFLEEIQHSQYVSETSPYLPHFCLIIEKIFSTGIKHTTNSLGFVKHVDAFTYFAKIADSYSEDFSYAFRSSVENVKQHRNVLTKAGKLRLFIRYSLVNKCLHVPVEYLVHNIKDSIYAQGSVLGDEILLEILLSVFRQCGKIPFNLNVRNASFLDYSWIIPQMVTLELVPTDSLGISVSFAGEKAVIVKICSDSVLLEPSQVGDVPVQVGDILDNLNGTHISSGTKGRLMNILKLNKNRPVKVTLIKAVYSDSKQLFTPVLGLLKQVRIDPETLRNLNVDTKEVESSPKIIKPSAGQKASYIGWVEIGSRGDVKQINKAATLLASPYPRQSHPDANFKKVQKDVCFEIGELGVKVVDPISSEIVLKHSYMEISSCGSVSFLYNYFAYVAGDDDCNVAKKFTCYIFEAANYDSCYTILQSIGQGFQRTHFAV